jgi:cyclophilin family peptidyl-prolyl cis-trans isomerase
LDELEEAIEDTSEDRKRGSSSSSKQRRGRRAERIAKLEEEMKHRRQRLMGLAFLIIVIAVVGSVSAYYVFIDDGGDGNGSGNNPIVVMETDYGVIEIELYMDETPKTAGNFKELVDKGFYNGLTFHRIIRGFMIQGGDPSGDGTGGPGYQIDDEASALDLEHDPFVISMANSGPDTGGSQFFIVTDSSGSHHLDGKHAVFGKVVAGQDVVMRIEKVPTNEQDRPLNQVVMRAVFIKEDSGGTPDS